MKKLKGFTLIEMIITIVVIIILSSISVPMYKGYKKQAIAAEGYVLLGAIRDAQMAYYNRYRNFLYYSQSSAGSAVYTNNEEVLGIDARGNKYFTWFHVGHGGNSSRLKYYFDAASKKPKELQSSNDTQLMLQYNISLGQRIINYPKDPYEGWY